MADAEDELQAVAERNLADRRSRGGPRVRGGRSWTAGRPAAHELPEGGWLAAAPLVTRSRTLGVLVLHDARRDSVAPDLELLEALGKQIGTGLDNVRLYAELRASSARVEALNRITATLTSGLDLKTVIPAFAQEMATIQPFDRLACGFVNDTGDYIEIVAHPEGTVLGPRQRDPGGGQRPRRRGPQQQGHPAARPRPRAPLHRGHAPARRGRALLRAPSLELARPRHRRARPRLRSRPRPTTMRPLARLQPLADSVALAFENVRLFQKTRELQHHRRGHAALQLPLLPPDPRPRAEARGPLPLGAVAALPRPRPLQAHQRPVRPPAGQPHAARGGLPDPRRGARDRLPGALRRRRVRGDPAPDRRARGARPWPRSSAS